MFFPGTVTLWVALTWLAFSFTPWWVAILLSIVSLPISLVVMMIVLVILESSKTYGLGGPKKDAF